MSRPKPVVLVILDGFGHREAGENNAITAANTPNLDRFYQNFPHGVINASELHVGLPEGQMGNSEVGHMNIGAGRVVMQELPRIDQAMHSGALAHDPQLLAFIKALKKSGGACHLMGLFSPGGVHAHQDHIVTLAKIVSSHGVPVRLHAFTDGRDTPPRSALDYLSPVNCQPSTVCGRYWAMDRDKRWERVSRAYTMLVDAQGERAESAEAAIQNSYARNESDEFIQPTIIGDYAGMRDGDGLLMANFRADRVREILSALLDPQFDGFLRKRVVKFAATLGMVEYSAELNRFIPALFPPQPLTHMFGEIIANAGLTQLRIAETEKYAHVTFFFNGGREEPYKGEERILVPSPKVATYDLKPEMSAYEVTDKLIEALPRFDVVIVNYANGDMVGHTGNIAAATQAVETLDTCLGKVWEVVKAHGGAMLLTADHGNAECMYDHATHQAHTAHTLNLVPAIVLAPQLEGNPAKLPDGKLADIAPTLLHLLGLKQPEEMSGQSLLRAVKL